MEANIVYRTILAFVFSVFVFIAIHAFRKWYDYSQNQKLQSLVSWSVAKGCRDFSLGAYLSNAQIEFHLRQKYRIAGDEEWEFVKEVLEEYQRDLTQSYFRGNLVIIKSKYVISGEDYFMLALYAFLSDHQCDYEFLGHDMHKERLEYKRYGDWGGPLFDATYALTDFAVVFHKMHYIAYMYCRKNDILREFVPAWNEDNLKEILDTKQIQISRL